MASLANVQVTVSTIGTSTTISLTYDATFTVFERHLVGLGLRFSERIQVQGVDVGAATALASLPEQELPVTDGTAPQVLTRSRSLTVARASLQEDPALGDADEIRCRIDVVPVGMPITASAFTATQTLAEPPVVPIPSPARTLRFVVSFIGVPHERTDFALDLNGDAQLDNQFGNLIGSLAAQNLDPQTAVGQGVAAFASPLLLTVKTEKSDLTLDQRIDTTVAFGTVVDAAQHTFRVDPSRPPVTLLGLQLAGRTVSQAPVVGAAVAMLPVTINLFAGVPVTLALRAPQVSFALAGDGSGVARGQVNGAMTAEDVTAKFGPALANGMSAMIAADPQSTTSKQLLQIFDIGGCTNPDGTQARAADGVIDVCEVLKNPIIRNVLLPDVKLFDGAGHFAPQPTSSSKDAFSVGLAFTASPATF